MTTLMIKTHNKTGLKYFCKSTLEGKSLTKYNGSGKYWKNHLKKHGKDIRTEIIAQYDEKHERNTLIDFALKFSEKNNIVYAINENGDRKGRKIWANLEPENGINGGSPGREPWNKNKINCYSEETKLKMSNSAKNKEIEYTDELRYKMGSAMRGKTNTISEETAAKISATLTHPNRYNIIGLNAPDGLYSKKQLKKISQGLLKTSKDKPLGLSDRGKLALNRSKKLHMIGWYIEEYIP